MEKAMYACGILEGVVRYYSYHDKRRKHTRIGPRTLALCLRQTLLQEFRDRLRGYNVGSSPCRLIYFSSLFKHRSDRTQQQSHIVPPRCSHGTTKLPPGSRLGTACAPPVYCQKRATVSHGKPSTGRCWSGNATKETLDGCPRVGRERERWVIPVDLLVGDANATWSANRVITQTCEARCKGLGLGGASSGQMR